VPDGTEVAIGNFTVLSIGNDALQGISTSHALLEQFVKTLLLSSRQQLFPPCQQIQINL